MTQAGVTALMQAVRSSAPPANPNTPNSRLDPRVEFLQALASTRKSLERLIDNTDDPVLKQVFSASHFAANKAMAGIDPPTILSTMLQALQSASQPGGMQPGAPMGQPIPTAPAGPPGPNPQMLAALSGGGMGGGMPQGPAPVASALGAQ
jgi:hypothetical protein